MGRARAVGARTQILARSSDPLKVALAEGAVPRSAQAHPHRHHAFAPRNTPLAPHSAQWCARRYNRIAFQAIPPLKWRSGAVRSTMYLRKGPNHSSSCNWSGENKARDCGPFLDTLLRLCPVRRRERSRPPAAFEPFPSVPAEADPCKDQTTRCRCTVYKRPCQRRTAPQLAVRSAPQ